MKLRQTALYDVLQWAGALGVAVLLILLISLFIPGLVARSERSWAMMFAMLMRALALVSVVVTLKTKKVWYRIVAAWIVVLAAMLWVLPRPSMIAPHIYVILLQFLCFLPLLMKIVRWSRHSTAVIYPARFLIQASIIGYVSWTLWIVPEYLFSSSIERALVIVALVLLSYVCSDIVGECALSFVIVVHACSLIIGVYKVMFPIYSWQLYVALLSILLLGYILYCKQRLTVSSA